MTQSPPRKEDVMISVLEMMMQPTEKKNRREEARRKRNHEIRSP